jgi:pyridoxal phosphate enzyme (YggS family)
MISSNILNLQKRILLACSKAKRMPQDLALIAVSKGHSVSEIKEALASGVRAIGENRLQEAALKYNALSATQGTGLIQWHMVGHLQTNKVRDAVRIFDLIHSVDSLRLAQEIDKQAARINKIQDILLEVKTSQEATKFGLRLDEVEAVIKEAGSLRNINIKGLMTIAPLLDNPQKARPYFRQLRELRDKINKFGILSMGMSDDFEVAIEEGADMIRIGRAIFES